LRQLRIDLQISTSKRIIRPRVVPDEGWASDGDAVVLPSDGFVIAILASENKGLEDASADEDFVVAPRAWVDSPDAWTVAHTPTDHVDRAPGFVAADIAFGGGHGLAYARRDARWNGRNAWARLPPQQSRQAVDERAPPSS